MTPLQVPGGVELLVLLLVLLFNLAIIALVVAGGVFLYRRWRGGGSVARTELDELRGRVADLEAQLEDLETAAAEQAETGERGDDADDR